MRTERHLPIHNDGQRAKWSAIYAGPEYFYGFDAGPVARRAVRYHRPLATPAELATPPDSRSAPTALDIGCGEGQDLAFLCECGYDAVGLDFVPDAIEKARQLLASRHLRAQLHAGDLRDWDWTRTFDLVLAVNALQFLGADAPLLLPRVLGCVAGGGVLGLSLFACEERSELRDGVFFIALEELMTYFEPEAGEREWQMLETTKLPFVTLIAQRLSRSGE